MNTLAASASVRATWTVRRTSASSTVSRTSHPSAASLEGNGSRALSACVPQPNYIQRALNCSRPHPRHQRRLRAKRVYSPTFGAISPGARETRDSGGKAMTEANDLPPRPPQYTPEEWAEYHRDPCGWCIKELRNPDSEIRCNAADILRGLAWDAEPAIPALVAGFQDPDVMFRSTAIATFRSRSRNSGICGDGTCRSECASRKRLPPR